MPSNGGSLANMWGRASAKPKPPSTTNSTAVASVAGIISQMLIFNSLCFTFLCITQHTSVPVYQPFQACYYRFHAVNIIFSYC